MRQQITIANALVVSKTEFERVNEHVNLEWPERFFAITLQEGDTFYVTFTRKHTKFAEFVQIGQAYTVTAQVKRVQEYGDKGQQTVLTNCVVGIASTKVDDAAAKKAAKTAARMAKLGL